MKKLRVGINARILDTTEIRGWNRYAIHLIDGLIENDCEVILFSDRPVKTQLLKNRIPSESVLVQSGKSYIDWEQRVLRKMAQQTHVDILHCPINYGLPFFSSCKRVLTLHDAIEKSFYDQKKTVVDKLNFTHLKMRALHYLSQNSAHRIITVSEFAKQDIMNHYGVPEKKISVVYEAASEQFQPKKRKEWDDLKSRYQRLEKEYLFYVGGLEERKNIDRMLMAYAKSTKQKQLVIAGGKEFERNYWQEVVRSYQIEKHVVFLGYVAEEDLPSLYFWSHAFVYPSLHEGFGLQAVESMAMERPVIGSNTTSLGEVIANNDCTFNPLNISKMAQKIDQIYDVNFYNRAKEKAILRGKDFSWDKCIKQTIDVYRQICF